MHYTTLFAASLLALTTLTSALPRRNDFRPDFRGRPDFRPDSRQCLSDADASEAADIFRKLIQDYSTDLALEALTEDFVDYSSAVNIIMNRGAEGPKNITGPTFASRAAFMAGQGSQPKIPFETLGVWHGCDSVSVRWVTKRSANGQAREVAKVPVVGNAIIATVPDKENSYGFRIKTLYSEFNAAAWLVNLGVFKPNGTLTPVKREEDNGLRGAII